MTYFSLSINNFRQFCQKKIQKGSWTITNTAPFSVLNFHTVWPFQKKWSVRETSLITPISLPIAIYTFNINLHNKTITIIRVWHNANLYLIFLVIVQRTKKFFKCPTVYQTMGHILKTIYKIVSISLPYKLRYYPVTQQQGIHETFQL